jgi:hypothetical protein
MTDDLNPHGIPRPGPLALLEADEMTRVSAELRRFVRARFAEAAAAVRNWEPGPPA